MKERRGDTGIRNSGAPQLLKRKGNPMQGLVIILSGAALSLCVLGFLFFILVLIL